VRRTLRWPIRPLLPFFATRWPHCGGARAGSSRGLRPVYGRPWSGVLVQRPSALGERCSDLARRWLVTASLRPPEPPPPNSPVSAGSPTRTRGSGSVAASAAVDWPSWRGPVGGTGNGALELGRRGVSVLSGRRRGERTDGACSSARAVDRSAPGFTTLMAGWPIAAPCWRLLGIPG